MIKNTQFYQSIVGCFALVISTSILATPNMGSLNLSLGAGPQAITTKIVEKENWTGGASSTTDSITKLSALGEASLSYTWAVQHFLIGLGSGFDYSDARASKNIAGNFAGNDYFEKDMITYKYAWNLYLTAGYLFTPRSDIFINLGPTYGRFLTSQSYKFTTQSFSTTTQQHLNLWGVSVGVGLGQKISDKFWITETINYLRYQSKTVDEIHGNPLDTINYAPRSINGVIALQMQF